MGNNKDKIKEIPVGAAIIRSPQEWAAISIAELDQAMQHLMTSRNILIERKLLTVEKDNFYKTAAEAMHNILKIYINEGSKKNG